MYKRSYATRNIFEGLQPALPSDIQPVPTTIDAPCCQKEHVLTSGYTRITFATLNQMSNFPSDINGIINLFFHETHESHIRRFAKALWRTSSAIPLTSPSPVLYIQSYSIQEGFSGLNIRKHIEKNTHLNNAVKYVTAHGVIENACDDLLSYKYINCIHGCQQKIYHPVVGFSASSEYLYQFDADKQKEFVAEDEPDRRAWIRGTQVMIYSEAFCGWKLGRIDRIDTSNVDMVVVMYGPSYQQMVKKVNRYENNVIQSTKEFITERVEWKKGSEVEVNGILPAKIDSVLGADQNILRIVYTYDEYGEPISQYLDRWSPDVQAPGTMASKLEETLNQYVVGTKVIVWSKSKQSWYTGIVIDVDSTYGDITVRYGDFEKKLPMDSDNIRLQDEESGAESGPELRNDGNLMMEKKGFEIGSKVVVWSHSQNAWIPGVVIRVMAEYEMIGVRYGDHEKFVAITSKDIKLLSNDDSPYPSFI